MSKIQKSKRLKEAHHPSPCTHISLVRQALRHQMPFVSYALLHQVPNRLVVAEPNAARVQVRVDNKMHVRLP